MTDMKQALEDANVREMIEKMKVINRRQNEDRISISMIGTGGGLSGQGWRNNNALVEHGDAVIMIDIGMTNADSAQNIKPAHIIITHMHPDHVGGLARHLLWCKYVAKMRPTIYIPGSFIVEMFGPHGEKLWDTNMLWDNYLAVQLEDGSAPDGSPVKLTFEDFADVVVCPVRIGLKDQVSFCTQKIDAGNGLEHAVTFEFYQIVQNAHHTPASPACGLIISNLCKRPPSWLIYTSDVRWHGGANITEGIANGASVIFHDVQIMGSPSPAGVHAHIDELLASNADLSRVVAMHHGFAPAMKYATLRDELLRLDAELSGKKTSRRSLYDDDATHAALVKVYALIKRGASIMCGDGNAFNLRALHVEHMMIDDFGIAINAPVKT
jgi:ribonuclease BN (tRNA processing enzyme)